MKIRISLVVLCLFLLFSTTGCQEKVKSNVDAVPIQPEPKAIIVEAVDSDPRTKEYATKLKEFSFDFDSDKEEEQIQLYTTAGRDNKGQMMWDDGQKWLLVIADGNRFYNLFSEYVQLGEVFFNVSTVGEQNMPQVSVLVVTHCGMELMEFDYSSEKQHFEGKSVYRDFSKNQLFTSIPSY